jgi:hypothetical protein
MMMTKRKPKPTRIYREEVHGAGAFNSTRQSFDKEQFDAWKRGASDPWLNRDSQTRFFVGTIDWTEA